jgi:hypothetical protein
MAGNQRYPRTNCETDSEQTTKGGSCVQAPTCAENAFSMCRIRTRVPLTSTPITSNRYCSPSRPCRSIQTEADRAISLRFLQFTAATGSPNWTPDRAFTSTKAINPCRSAIRSMSRWPDRYRRSRTRHPCPLSHRSATRSPVTPNRLVSIVTRPNYNRLSNLCHHSVAGIIARLRPAGRVRRRT